MSDEEFEDYDDDQLEEDDNFNQESELNSFKKTESDELLEDLPTIVSGT
jgi:hypothetical protein